MEFLKPSTYYSKYFKQGCPKIKRLAFVWPGLFEYLLEHVIEDAISDCSQAVEEGVQVPLACEDSQMDDDDDQWGKAENGHDFSE